MLAEQGGETIVVDPAWKLTTADAAINEYCDSHGWGWSERFFGPLGSPLQPSLNDFTCGYEDLLAQATDPAFPDAPKLVCFVSVCNEAKQTTGRCPDRCESDVCNYEPNQVVLAIANIASLQVGAIMATNALYSSEFIVGTLMSLYGLKVLLPPCISLVRA
jgi:hypothetical protein